MRSKPLSMKKLYWWLAEYMQQFREMPYSKDTNDEAIGTFKTLNNFLDYVWDKRREEVGS